MNRKWLAICVLALSGAIGLAVAQQGSSDSSTEIAAPEGDDSVVEAGAPSTPAAIAETPPVPSTGNSLPTLAPVPADATERAAILAPGVPVATARDETIIRVEENPTGLPAFAEKTETTAVPPTSFDPFSGTVVTPGFDIGVDPEYLKLETQARQLAAKYDQAPEDQRTGIREELKKVTENQFKLKQERLNKTAAQIETRLQEVKKKIALREQNRDSIIERRIDQLLNRDDLEWESGTTRVNLPLVGEVIVTTQPATVFDASAVAPNPGIQPQSLPSDEVSAIPAGPNPEATRFLGEPAAADPLSSPGDPAAAGVRFGDDTPEANPLGASAATSNRPAARSDDGSRLVSPLVTMSPPGDDNAKEYFSTVRALVAAKQDKDSAQQAVDRMETLATKEEGWNDDVVKARDASHACQSKLDSLLSEARAANQLLELDIQEAEEDYQLAMEEFNESERLHEKGYIGTSEIRKLKRETSRAKSRLLKLKTIHGLLQEHLQ